MSVMIYDATSKAFKESPTPMIYSPSDQAWTDTTGLAYNPYVEAWEEVWSSGIDCTVYGGALETITFSDGTVCVTDKAGKATAKLKADTPLTATGSISGYTSDVQIMSESNTTFYAMPINALYWYGNECTWLTGGWSYMQWANSSTRTADKYTNYINIIKTSSQSEYATCIGLNNYLDNTMACKTFKAKGTTVKGTLYLFNCPERNISNSYDNINFNSTKYGNDLILDASFDTTAGKNYVGIGTNASGYSLILNALWAE